MAEQVYFNRNWVWISSTRVVFANKTYALAAITSVESGEVDPDRTGPYVTVLGGVLVCVLAVFLYFESVLLGAAPLVLGLTVIVLGAVWAFRIKPMYAVILCTAASEWQAWVSDDEDEIREIVDALNQAIIDRG